MVVGVVVLYEGSWVFGVVGFGFADGSCVVGVAPCVLDEDSCVVVVLCVFGFVKDSCVVGVVGVAAVVC